MSLHSLVKWLFYRAGYSVKRLRPAKVACSADPLTVAEVDVRAMLHAVDLYAGFDYSALPQDLHGWGSESSAFRELVAAIRPRRIVEVGTWKGASAIHMAEVAAELGLEVEVICVDTWLGAVEFWTDQTDVTRYGSLRLKNGWPQVYYQFLANVCHRGQQHRIIPFPQTSANAALWMRMHGARAKLIYVDGSHEEDDVLADLIGWWDVLVPGGVMFGDDWSWDGVRLAVSRFAREAGIAVRFVADKWALDKK